MPDRRAALIHAQNEGQTLRFCHFWGHSGQGPGPWALSQWWEAPVVHEGLTYRTAEHWMMAEKARLFGDADALERVLAAPSPGAAKAVGRTVRDFEQSVWEEARFAVVRTGNDLKFRQHPALGAWLLATGSAVLVEASPRDTVWGIGLSANNPAAQVVASWRGLNLLGFVLMEVRDRLRRVPVPREPEGTIVPPWKFEPNEPCASLFWRMGAGEAHVERFGAWWSGLGADDRLHLELLYPATGSWAGWWDEDEGA